jgi:F-type H+-transporting ATPase subunit gamma
MESMRDIRNRMVSVRKTMKITNAMYLMASSKMKKARRNLAASEPYFLELQKTITDILINSNIPGLKYFNGDKPIPEEELRRCFIVITSDKGLAGAYNQNVIKLTEAQLIKSKKNSLLFIGYAGHNYFKKKLKPEDIDADNSYAAVEPTLFRARSVAEHVVENFRNGTADEIYVVYTKMINSLTAKAEIIKLLTMSRDMFPYDNIEDAERTDTHEKLYDPSPEAVFEKIVPNYVKGLIYGAMIEAYASEQSARMTAMDNATKNAKEISEKLSLLYNRIRQAAITTELIEVVGGANAQE